MPDPGWIQAYPDGPLLVRGEFELRDAGGGRYERTRRTVALCRCGRSRIKPLCDGTHKVAGFESGPGGQAGRGAAASTGPSSELSPRSQQPSSRFANSPSR